MTSSWPQFDPPPSRWLLGQVQVLHPDSPNPYNNLTRKSMLNCHNLCTSVVALGIFSLLHPMSLVNCHLSLFSDSLFVARRSSPSRIRPFVLKMRASTPLVRRWYIISYEGGIVNIFSPRSLYRLTSARFRLWRNIPAILSYPIQVLRQNLNYFGYVKYERSSTPWLQLFNWFI